MFWNKAPRIIYGDNWNAIGKVQIIEWDEEKKNAWKLCANL